MTRWYLDTSAALKLIADEAESDALAAPIDDAAPDLVAEMPPSLHREAGLQRVRTCALDALHLAASIRIDVETVLTYDARMARAAPEVGLPVLAPS